MTLTNDVTAMPSDELSHAALEQRAEQRPSESPHAHGVTPAAERTLDILEFIATHGETRAAMLARELGIPRSSVYQLLDVLERHGFVTCLKDRHTYGIGLKTFEMGSAYSRQHRVSRIAHPVLARLVDDTGENGHLAVLHGSQIVYVLEERAAGRPPLVSGVGVRLPSHLTASGRAMLAGLPRAQVDALYPNRAAFVDRTGIGPKSPKELRALLSQVHATGFAEEHGDVTPGFDSYAVAIRDYNGYPIAGLALTFVSNALSAERLDALRNRLKLAGEELSRDLR
ncbi:MAG: IclR family transcriptional regulator [Bifidobacterium tibiigranuli]|uniref:IclR family transcriptional regulator n=1 Tax=Bifidobacterium tibiigranuli TaxID=2172043 RepID=UPI0026EA626B|nr:IclR family transcriptional regulator [Bifidobacterium tibiigranuli]MCI1674099.1 IclR family transcriptional regulator [Bifidobacterium tibiigranuli]MCI1712848.1 IclR family transcriptional regulator [Bifidobacterium tibiigranuli]MCI1834179.1 IclR family transcriptional regulator [Bifidobacterium tibiigranuli]